MFKQDIEKVFTEKVQEYLMKGYRFYSDGMRGSQGEIAKVVLTDDNELIIVYLTDEFYPRIDVRSSLILYVTKQEPTNGTVWLNRGDVLEKTEWYDIGIRGRHYYVESTDPELNNILTIKNQRRNYREPSNKNIISSKAKKVILPLVKRQPKCKSKTINDIERIVRYRINGSCYYAIYLKDGKIIRLQSTKY